MILTNLGSGAYQCITGWVIDRICHLNMPNQEGQSDAVTYCPAPGPSRGFIHAIVAFPVTCHRNSCSMD